jgi:hypothetical protein
MQKMRLTILLAGVSLLGLLFNADAVLATQAHGAPEGIYAHQAAHIFFIIAMGILIYWLRARSLVKESGWRFLQYAALFFILWSIDTFLVHLLDEQLDIIQVTQLGPWQIRIDDSIKNNLLIIFYYIAKLDHLLCLPALLFLYAGLKRLFVSSDLEGIRNGLS